MNSLLSVMDGLHRYRDADRARGRFGGIQLRYSLEDANGDALIRASQFNLIAVIDAGNHIFVKPYAYGIASASEHARALCWSMSVLTMAMGALPR